MSRVLVLGNATIDQIQHVERLPLPGETVLALGMSRCAGGKGLNQAVAAARAGAHTRLAASVGRDADAAFLARSLGGEPGLDVDWLACDAPTDLSAIWVARGGENVIVSSADCARSITPAQAGTLCETLVETDILLMQGNLTAETTRAAAQAARARGATCLLNTAPIAWDMAPILTLFDIVIANAGEAAILTRDAAELGPALRGRGVGTAIVTLGAKGALIVEAAGETLLPAPPVSAVDTAGAGDVFAGTLAGLLATGRPLQVAAAVAVAAASLSVTRRNTTPSFPTREEVAALVAQVGRRGRSAAAETSEWPGPLRP